MDERGRAGAGTVHVGGTLGEIAAAEAEVTAGRHSERPFILVVQQSQFDPSRAPAGKHTAWAYCHVPSGSTVDMTARIEAQIERFAPGFGDIVLARATRTAPEVNAYNENYIGGDINVGLPDWRQLIFRPIPSLNPYATPAKGIYLASSATPPGGGVHGMCGHRAALSALSGSSASAPEPPAARRRPSRRSRRTRCPPGPGARSSRSRRGSAPR